MTEHYGTEDPETGCAMLATIIAVASAIFYVVSFLLFGWQGILDSLITCGIVAGVVVAYLLGKEPKL